MYLDETTNVRRSNTVNKSNWITVSVHLQLARDTRVPYSEVNPLLRWQFLAKCKFHMDASCMMFARQIMCVFLLILGVYKNPVDRNTPLSRRYVFSEVGPSLPFSPPARISSTLSDISYG